MADIYRSPSLENKELEALYGEDGDCYFDKDEDEDCISEEYDQDSESSEEGKGGKGIRSSLSLEIYGLQREQNVYFSNQEYYRRLEELKSNHLRNMAELERMYISQGTERNGGGDDGCLGRNKEARLSGPARRLQRINSQEELDFHESSSSSDQSEHCGEDSMGEMAWTPTQDGIFERDVLLSPERTTNQNQLRFQPTASSPKPRGRVSRQTGAGQLPNSKVTVPKPFQMMLREEERKKHRVRTRSEIEVENMLLRRELEELRECQKKFRASPAPAHIHLPLYEMISCRSSQRSNQSRSSSKKTRNPDVNGNQTSTAVSPQPFHFLERERRKREAKIVEELGNFGQKMERQTFKARPLPVSIYGTRHREDPMTTSCSHESQTFYTLEGGSDGQSDQSSDLELEMHQSDSSLSSRMSQRSPSSKPVKKQIELSIEMVAERERPSTEPRSWAAQSFC